MSGWRGGDKPELEALAAARCAMLGARLTSAGPVFLQDAPASAQSGRSSGVEHNLAKVGVEGSNPFARSSSSGHLTHPAKRRSHCWCVRRSGLCGSASWRIAMTEQAELTRTEPRDKLQTVNPATDEPGRSYDQNTLAEAKDAAAAAHRAFEQWRRTSFGERSAVIRRAAEILRDRKDEFARLMTEEMGKTLDDGRAEIEKCAFQ